MQAALQLCVVRLCTGAARAAPKPTARLFPVVYLVSYPPTTLPMPGTRLLWLSSTYRHTPSTRNVVRDDARSRSIQSLGKCIY